MIIEDIPRCVKNNIKDSVKPMSIENAMKISTIAVHLINKPICGKNYNEFSFSILRKCTNYFNVIKLEATLIKHYKPKLYKQIIFLLNG